MALRTSGAASSCWDFAGVSLLGVDTQMRDAARFARMGKLAGVKGTAWASGSIVETARTALALVGLLAADVLEVGANCCVSALVREAVARRERRGC